MCGEVYGWGDAPTLILTVGLGLKGECGEVKTGVAEYQETGEKRWSC